MAVQDDLAGLVEVRNLLLDMQHLNQSKTAAAEYHEHVRHMLGASDLYQNKVIEYHGTVHQLNENIQQCVDDCTNLLAQVEHDISQLTQSLLTEEHFVNNLQIGYATRKNWVVPQETIIELVAEFNHPDVWKYPVACINIQHQGVLDLLLFAKLIYLVDADQELLDMSYQAEHAQVLSRVKKHKLVSWNDLDFGSNITRVRQNLRWGLPSGQMSHVFCWNIFERYTYATAVRNLKVIKDILRPGGKVIFSINNADSIIGAQAATANTGSYMTEYLVMKLLNEVDLELVSYRKVLGDNVCMVVAKAAGNLHSYLTNPPRGLVKKS